MASGNSQTKRRKLAERDSPNKYEQLLSRSTQVIPYMAKHLMGITFTVTKKHLWLEKFQGLAVSTIINE